MGGEWSEVEFGDLLQNGTRNGVYKSKEFHGVGVKIVNMGEVFAHPRLWDVPMKRVELADNELQKSSLQPGDLLFARRSLVAEGAGKCSIVMEISEPTTFESSIIRARPDYSKANSLFLYYFFNSPQGRYLLSTIRRQVAVAGITGSDLVKLPVLLPRLQEQKAVAQLLGTLDDKIELNRQMNRTLEAMARAIFKAWFVDFEPVKAKAEGATSFRGMPQEVFDHLPDRFVESELGPVPEGWGYEPIGDLVDVVGGGTPSTKNPEFWEGGEHAFCTPKDMSKLSAPILLDTERHITQAGLDKISSGQLPVGAVLLSSRAPIGYLALAETPVSVNQGIIAMITDEIPNTYILLWTETNMEEIKSRAGGSTFAEISKRNFRPIPALRPDDTTLQAFGENAQVLFARIASNERESRTLASIRDTLLPKLISGEIRIPEAVEGADGG